MTTTSQILTPPHTAVDVFKYRFSLLDHLWSLMLGNVRAARGQHALNRLVALACSVNKSGMPVMPNTRMSKIIRDLVQGLITSWAGMHQCSPQQVKWTGSFADFTALRKLIDETRSFDLSKLPFTDYAERLVQCSKSLLACSEAASKAWWSTSDCLFCCYLMAREIRDLHLDPAAKSLVSNLITTLGDCIAVNEKALASHSPQKWSAAIILGAWLAHQNIDPRINWQQMCEGALSLFPQVSVMLLRNGIPGKPVRRLFGSVLGPQQWCTAADRRLLDALERSHSRGSFTVSSIYIDDTMLYSSDGLLELDNN